MIGIEGAGAGVGAGAAQGATTDLHQGQHEARQSDGLSSLDPAASGFNPIQWALARNRITEETGSSNFLAHLHLEEPPPALMPASASASGGGGGAR